MAQEGTTTMSTAAEDGEAQRKRRRENEKSSREIRNFEDDEEIDRERRHRRGGRSFDEDYGIRSRTERSRRRISSSRSPDRRRHHHYYHRSTYDPRSRSDFKAVQHNSTHHSAAGHCDRTVLHKGSLADKLPIFYGRTVNRVQYGSDGVMVYTNGQVFRGDVALCTFPLGVLKKGSIEFVPPLPIEKQDAIKRLGFGLLNKVAMLFPHDFWGGGIDTFGHLTEDSNDRGEFFLFYSYSSVSGGPLLIALVAGESAVKFETVSPVEPVAKVLGVLRGIFSPKGIQVPDPVQVVCTRWGSDKFAYGSYSYIAVGSSGDDYDILAENVGNGRVFFAGEATNKRYPATMHGAYLSGLREAAAISRIHKGNPTIVVPKDEFPHNLDDLFKNPDISFGGCAVLYDPDSTAPNSPALLRVEIEGKLQGSTPLFLYGLFQRKLVMELQSIDGDENRLAMLHRNYGTKLVGSEGLGSSGEALANRIWAGKVKNTN